MRLMMAAMAALVLAAPAAAGTITIELPGDVDRQQVRYDCAGLAVEVDYINAGVNSLAILHLPEGPVIVANVISASGARYAGQQYIWWTRRDEAALYDVRQARMPSRCPAAPAKLDPTKDVPSASLSRRMELLA